MTERELSELEIELERVLTRQQHEVAVLCWLKGRTHSYAGAVLGIAEESVRSRLRRARDRMRRHYQEADR